MINKLLGKGAFLEAEDRNGLNPLLVAGLRGDVPMVLSLLERTVKPVMSSFDGKVNLAWTILTADEPELRNLLSRFKRSAITAPYPMFNRTLLHRAVLTLKDEALVETVVALLDASDRNADFC